MTINEVTVPAPQRLTVGTVEAFGTSVRCVSGALAVDRAAVKRTLKLEWPKVGAQDAARLAAAVTSLTFEAVYPDPLTHAAVTGTFHCAESAFEACCWDANGAEWKTVKMTWEEV